MLAKLALLFPLFLYSIYRIRPESISVAIGLYAAITASYFVFRVFIYPFYFSPLRHLPEPEGGSFPWYHADAIRKQNNGEPFRTWINSVPNNGLVRYRVLFNEEHVFLSNPDALKEVLVKKSYEFPKPPKPVYLFRKILGNGVLTAEGDDHKRQRKALMPAFSFRHVKDLYPVFWDKGRQVTDAIAVSIQSQRTQNAYDWASRVTLDIIGLAGFDHDFNSISDPTTEINRTYKQLFSRKPAPFAWDLTGLKVPLGLLYYMPIPLFRISRKSASTIREIAYQMIRRKRLALEKGQLGGIDIMSIALDSGEFSDEDLANQCMTFLAAGHETTASAMTWATYLLSKHPKVQTRLREEIRAQLPSVRDPDTTVQATQVDRVLYLNAVCNEVLRLMSSVPLTRRVAMHDTEIIGQHIPKGVRITIPAWAINASHELWGADSLEFIPDRWMGEGKANTGGAPSNYALSTFSHGPRSCIGKDFAKSEFACLLAAWVGRFEIQLAEPDWEAKESNIEGWVTVKPKGGLPVVFKEVEGW